MGIERTAVAAPVAIKSNTALEMAITASFLPARNLISRGRQRAIRNRSGGQPKDSSSLRKPKDRHQEGQDGHPTGSVQTQKCAQDHHCAMRRGNLGTA